ncbi:DUF1223 domain-containing protein [Psychromarinibacter sp. C21-152]|uniref:DUF1223 domain-containing protein n=1 Tax=Psychromarinibacter sediminicola TaxID=3033385 RepID=A0AAE3NUA3_9RHOB|nr:DUF1223 domain-containing protein [Psychromarinibacter sediminicola]MDF0602496.1 DUF1223 domain-containing protein [Psychromarinibacter sediminicola]
MRLLWAALSLAAAVSAGPDRSAAQSAEDPVVVELFTSQGCSSCPPADALLAELAGRDDVIALALHVDYWDYIGWTDSFGDSAFTTRQKGYARASGHRTIYTPQMIVEGHDHVVGYKPMKLAELIGRHGDAAPLADLTLRREGDKLHIRAEARGALPRKLLVQLVRYLPEGTVDIRKGENAGRTIKYTNIVTEWEVLGGWDGTEPLEMEVAVDGDKPCVVVLQEPGHGAIVAAARLR